MFKNIQARIISSFVSIILLVSLLTLTTLALDNIQDAVLPGFQSISKYVDSNRYTHLDDLRKVENQVSLFVDPTIIDTEMGTVYFDPEALAFQFINENNYIWSSTINYDASSLSPNWIRRVRSAIHIESFNTNSNNFALTEEFVLSEGTKKTTKLIDNGFESRITFGKSRISLLLRVTFREDGIHVEVPDDEIKEDGSFKLHTVKVYPFFGAVLEADIPGYVFVPDGIGALVRYHLADPAIIANYEKEIYGRNLGYSDETNLNNIIPDGSTIQAPVFGFVHGINQNAIFGNILSGAQYGSLNIYYSGKTTAYTTVFPKFVYRRTYKQPIDRAGNSISLLQDYRNKVDLKVLYTPLIEEEANYVGMAKLYRQQLGLISKIPEVEDIPLKLETIGLEKSPGVLFNDTTVMTTFSDYTNIIKDLKTNGIDNIIGVYAGYTNSGVSWAPPVYKSLSRKLGNKTSFKTLVEEVSELYLVSEYIKASSKASGYSTYNDLAKKINDQNYTYQNFSDEKFLLKPEKTKALFEESINKLSAYEITGLAVQSLGNTLYADYKNQFYLEDTISLYQNLLSEVNFKLSLYQANSYLWKYLDNYFDFPMYSSQYIYFSDTVPFLSIVLSGIPLFAGNANFYPYPRDELLRLIDFGVNPSFLVTEKSSKELQDTELEYIYTSRYQDLKAGIATYYDFVNQALRHVSSSKISNRQVVEAGLVRVDYDNQISIIINYTENEKDYLEFSVLPKNYLLLSADELLLAGYLEAVK
ncbi:MAG: DUF5696 domain-containing protein [Bacilli bacterium]|nr:DUF5696 domain-containing protein [Bacilli bacterium]